MDRLRSLVYGQSLTGAGGGGFYFALVKKPYTMEHIKQVVAAMEVGITDLQLMVTIDYTYPGTTGRRQHHFLQGQRRSMRHHHEGRRPTNRYPLA